MEVVHLEQQGVAVRLGKRLATISPDPDVVRMADFVRMLEPSVVRRITDAASSSLPDARSSGWGWGYVFGEDGWGMLGNGPADPGSNLPEGSAARDQGAGDCWWSAFAHRLRLWAKLAGRPLPPISDLTLLEQYSAYVEFAFGQPYDLQTGSGDEGTDPLQAYKYLQGHPFRDDAGNEYPVGQPISLTPGSVQEHLIATYCFEGTGVGVQLQQAQVDQFDQGKPLAYVKGSPVVGGHELLQAGPNGMVEWGRRIGFETSFIARCNDQSECVFSVEMFNLVTGRDATHAGELDVEAYASAIVKKFA